MLASKVRFLKHSEREGSMAQLAAYDPKEA